MGGFSPSADQTIGLDLSLANGGVGRISPVTMIADGFVAWLVALVGGAGRRKLTQVVLGTDEKRALARVAEMAIRRTATAWRQNGAGVVTIWRW